MQSIRNLVVTAVFAIVVTALTIGCEAAQKAVAVMPFENISGSAQRRVAEIMTEQMTVALANSGSLGWQQTGMVSPDQMKQFGQMSGADYTIVGKITMAAVVENKLPIPIPSQGREFMAKYKGKISLNFRFIDNESGQIVLAKQIDASESDNNKEVAYNKACKEAAEKILKEIQKSNPVTATIVDSEDGIVYIDKGSDVGLQQGDALVVFKEGKVIRDAQGNILTVKTTELGKVKIKEIYGNYAICRVSDGMAPKGAKVRRVS